MPEQPAPDTRVARRAVFDDLRAYAWLALSLVVCRLALSFVSLDFKNDGQRLIFDSRVLAAIVGYGILGVLLLRRTGFPGVPTTRRGVRLGLLLGAALGLASIAVDIVRPLEQVRGLESVHHPLPEGIAVYWYGGVISEIVFHLVPVPFFVFVVSNLARRGRNQEAAFWMALGVLSAWEDRRFWSNPDLWLASEVVRSMVTYGANAAEIWLFRRHGFMAAIAQRMTSYSLWHIAWPALRG